MGALAINDLDAYGFRKSQLHITWLGSSNSNSNSVVAGSSNNNISSSIENDKTRSSNLIESPATITAANSTTYTTAPAPTTSDTNTLATVASDGPTSCFALVLMDSLTGQCEYIIANLDTVKAIDTNKINENLYRLSTAPIVVLDANLSCSTIVKLIELCHRYNRHLFIEPTDVLALPQLVEALNQTVRQQSNALGSIVCMTPNLIELKEMLRLFEQDGKRELNNVEPQVPVADEAFRVDEAKRVAETLLNVHIPNVRSLIVTLDRDGILLAVRSKASEADLFNANEFNLLYNNDEVSAQDGSIVFQHFPAPQVIEQPVSGSGAGDSFAAGFISGLLNNETISACVHKGFLASLLALQDKDTIPMGLRDLANTRPTTK